MHVDFSRFSHGAHPPLTPAKPCAVWMRGRAFAPCTTTGVVRDELVRFIVQVWIAIVGYVVNNVIHHIPRCCEENPSDLVHCVRDIRVQLVTRQLSRAVLPEQSARGYSRAQSYCRSWISRDSNGRPLASVPFPASVNVLPSWLIVA
jgi:hypothetical protein